MASHLTVADLEARWERALVATRRAVAAHPAAYRQLKAQAAQILDQPVDINDYFSAVEQLVDRLDALDPEGQGSIFAIFSKRIAPTTIWQVRTLRMECKDLLAHLAVFDQWRRDRIPLRMVSGRSDDRPTG